MLHRDIKTLKDLGPELIYNDQLTGEPVMGIVGRVEQLNPNIVFVYIVSPYDKENDKIEPDGFRYKEIMIFDNRPQTEHGWHKNAIEAMGTSSLNR